MGSTQNVAHEARESDGFEIIETPSETFDSDGIGGVNALSNNVFTGDRIGAISQT
jgi:hypothetical protein